MQVHTRHTPAFGVARVSLAPGEAVQAVSDTLVANSFGITEARQSRGGLRVHGKGEPSVFTAPKEGGWLDLAPAGPGDVYPLELDGRVGWNVAKQAFLARPSTVRVDAGWRALQVLFGGDGGFLEHYSGTGPLVLACAGPVDALKIEAGALITVRPPHLLAYPDTVQCRLRAVDPSGPQSIRTGEGLAFDFAGPGTVLVQARKSP
ncbi:AIM24 family protein [Amycolatopsis pithecellobii]|uniref:TIGR00266 family protein n=1 Tax=Amycolatopsis pithecellobii TaxID=664692 RepID=A0A6N7ZA79_9PSEU|nr:AIM24 family protein [Amycolatopsis pithecellobii]MTD58619.1 TIGR00266 family protein [Amycolatopsis pithecellobii]